MVLFLKAVKDVHCVKWCSCWHFKNV